VIRVEPDSSATLASDGRVRFHFDERISEQVSEGDLQAAVTVSPLTGSVRVSHGRTALTVSLEGGFRPGLVYRVTLLPVVSDLFGNRMTEAFEVVFSTGGSPEATATLAGEVWDRLTGQGVRGATVRAVGADSLVHVARADQEGIFAFRYLPAGDFVVTGFQDLDRDGAPGPREPQGSVPASLTPGDTVLMEIPVLPMDTTPADVGGARALDATTIVVDFDDYLDPTVPVDRIEVRLTREDGAAPSVDRLFHEQEYGRYVDQVADSFARLDSIDAATGAGALPDSGALGVADSLPAPDSARAVVPGDAGAGVEPRPGRATPPRLSGSRGAQASSGGRTLPTQRIVARLAGPLEGEVEYRVRVDGVVNVNGLDGGGGEASLVYTPPAPDTSSVTDPADVDGTDDDGAADVDDDLADPAARP